MALPKGAAQIPNFQPSNQHGEFHVRYIDFFVLCSHMCIAHDAGCVFDDLQSVQVQKKKKSSKMHVISLCLWTQLKGRISASIINTHF